MRTWSAVSPNRADRGLGLTMPDIVALGSLIFFSVLPVNKELLTGILSVNKKLFWLMTFYLSLLSRFSLGFLLSFIAVG